jgi:thioredoxin reductase
MDYPPAPMFDVAIVGGGPAGLSAALMLARACRRVVVFDSGQPRNLAARAVHGFVGRDGTKPRDLIEDGRAELARYGVEVVDDEVIEACRIRTAPARAFSFLLRTQGGRTLESRKLLLATGVRDELPDYPGVRDCYGITVHHCPYCDGWEHRGKRLLAYGSTPEAAAGLALSLQTWSNQVTALTGGLPLATEDRDKLMGNGIEASEARILRLAHCDGQLQGVELAGSGLRAADALFFNTSHSPASKLPKALGCRTDGDGVARTRPKQKTDVPGLYLAGDADGDVQFAIVAAGEGATAAVAINRELQDEDQA